MLFPVVDVWILSIKQAFLDQRRLGETENPYFQNLGEGFTHIDLNVNIVLLK